MQVSNVENIDGRMLANLVSFIQKGKWELSGEEAEILTKTKQWLGQIALQVANEMKKTTTQGQVAPVSPAPASTGFKIKSMGQLPKKISKKK